MTALVVSFLDDAIDAESRGFKSGEQFRCDMIMKIENSRLAKSAYEVGKNRIYNLNTRTSHHIWHLYASGVIDYETLREEMSLVTNELHITDAGIQDSG